MPEDATRKLLKLFGIALMDFEDQTKSTLERLRALGPRDLTAATTLELADQWLKANGDVMARWLEVTQLLMQLQAEAQAELLRIIGTAQESPH